MSSPGSGGQPTFRVIHMIGKCARISSALLVLLCVTGVPSSAQNLSYTVPTSQAWTDTGMDLQAGSTLAITASATATAGCDPAGVQGKAAGDLPMPAGLPGALLARLQANGPALLVGASQELKVSEAGHLWLG